MKKFLMGFSLGWMFMPFVLWGASDPDAEEMARRVNPNSMAFEQTSSPLSDPLGGWRLPGDHKMNISTLSLSGTILYRNTFPINKTEPKIIQLTLVDEDMSSAIFDLEYYLPRKYASRESEVHLFSGYPFANGKSARSGRHVVRFHFSADQIDAFFFATDALNVRIENKNQPFIMTPETILFRKIWINPSHKGEGYFLKTNPTMRITRTVPQTLSWENGLTLFGDFRRARNLTESYVVLGGGRGNYHYLEILEWQEDRMVVEAPKFGRSPNYVAKFDPELPYFLSVVLGEEHSNLFLVKLDSKGLPQ